jgi:hypothetical protein
MSLTFFIKYIHFANNNARDIKLPFSTTKELITSGLLQKIQDINQFKEEFSEIVFSPGDQFNFLSTSDRKLVSIEIDYVIPSSYIKQYFLYYFQLLETLFQKDKVEIELNPERFKNTYIGLGPTEIGIMKQNCIPLTMLDRYKFKVQQYTTELQKIKSNFEIEIEKEIDNEKFLNQYNELLDELEGLYTFNVLLGSFDRIPTATFSKFGKESKKWLYNQIKM